MKPIVILDTNILLDILVFDDQRAHPLRSAIEEFVDVISRPQFDLNADQQYEVSSQWQSWARVLDDSTLIAAPWKCKDRDDQVFINLAYSLRPAILISKDKLVLKVAKRAIKEDVIITSDHNKFAFA